MEVRLSLRTTADVINYANFFANRIRDAVNKINEISGYPDTLAVKLQALNNTLSALENFLRPKLVVRDPDTTIPDSVIESPIDRLPDNVLGKILALLPTESLIKVVPLVCKRWNALSHSAHFKRKSMNEFQMIDVIKAAGISSFKGETYMRACRGIFSRYTCRLTRHLLLCDFNGTIARSIKKIGYQRLRVLSILAFWGRYIHRSLLNFLQNGGGAVNNLEHFELCIRSSKARAPFGYQTSQNQLDAVKLKSKNITVIKTKITVEMLACLWNRCDNMKLDNVWVVADDSWGMTGAGHFLAEFIRGINFEGKEKSLTVINGSDNVKVLFTDSSPNYPEFLLADLPQWPELLF